MHKDTQKVESDPMADIWIAGPCHRFAVWSPKRPRVFKHPAFGILSHFDLWTFTAHVP